VAKMVGSELQLETVCCRAARGRCHYAGVVDEYVEMPALVLQTIGECAY
jgi:hypothetical protein